MVEGCHNSSLTHLKSHLIVVPWPRNELYSLVHCRKHEDVGTTDLMGCRQGYISDSCMNCGFFCG